jgi:membrane associated rhomboid family serine protease
LTGPDFKTPERAVSSRFPTSTRPPFGGFSLGGPPPRDVLVLLGVLLVTFSLRFFDATRIVPALLELTPAVWRRGWVWQLLTYPFVGTGRAGIWFLLELFFLGMFGRDVFHALGRRRFWRLLAGAALAGSVVAVLVQLAGGLLAGGPAFTAEPFVLLQGQHALFAIVIAAFATLYADATILLFFVLPVRARWFLLLEVLFAFMAFLPTHDLAGFAGVCAAIAWTWFGLTPGTPRRKLREFRLQLERRWIQYKLERMKKKRGLRVIPGERGRGSRGGRGPGRGNDPWTH